MDNPWIDAYSDNSDGIEITKQVVKELVKRFQLSNAQLAAFHTDMIKLDEFWKDGSESKLEDEMQKISLNDLLELRIFNEKKELKIWRSSIKNKFYYRIANDEKVEKEDRIEMFYYLSIKEEDGFVRTKNARNVACDVSFPLTDNTGVRIVYYINYYDNTGQANIADWRIIKIEKEINKDGKKMGGRSDSEIY